MSFYTKRLLSHYPEKFKMRNDESSNGYKMYSVFSEVLENIYYENYSIRRFMSFHNMIRQVDSVWKVDLAERDLLTNSKIWPLPVIFSGTRRLLFRDNFVDFLFLPPDRFKLGLKTEVNEWEIYDSSQPGTFKEIKEPEHLLIDATNLGEFLTGGNVDQKNLEFFYNYYVSIKGFDELYNPIEENVFIVEKECYLTKNVFKEVTSVDWDGFEGDFKIYLSSKKQNYKKMILSHNYLQVLDNLRNLKLSIYKDANNRSYLRYDAVLYRNAIAYSKSSILEAEKDLFILDQIILDENGNYLNILDFAIDPNSKKIYMIDDSSKLHVYSIGLTPFKEFKEKTPKSNFINFLDIENRSGLFEEIEYSLNFKDFRAGIEKYRVWRYSPDGTKSYLQSDKTWNASSHYFNFNLLLGKQERMKGISFQNYFDTLGQWEFYVEVKYEIFEEVELISTATICESIEPYAEYDLSDFGISFDGIFYDKKRDLCLSEGLNYYGLREESDAFSWSPLFGRVMLRSEHKEIEVIVPTEVSFKTDRNKYKSILNGDLRDSILLKKGERHCIVQEKKMNNDFPLTFSIYSNRSIALQEPELEVIYYIDSEKVLKSDYLNRLSTGDYGIIEIIIPPVEEDAIYCYTDNYEEISIKLSFTEKDIFERLNENHGYV